MIKSRTAPILLVFAAAASPMTSTAQTVDARNWVDAQSAELREALRLDCPPAADDGAIVVCGSREENRRQRLPLPVDRPPQAADQAGGEQRSAMAIDSSRCTTVGRDQQCGMLDILGMGVAVAKAIVQEVVEGD